MMKEYIVNRGTLFVVYISVAFLLGMSVFMQCGMVVYISRKTISIDLILDMVMIFIFFIMGIIFEIWSITMIFGFWKKAFVVIIDDTTVKGIPMLGNGEVIIRYEDIELIRPAFSLLLAMLIKDKNGKKMYVASHIDDFGDCMERVKGYAKNAKVDFGNWPANRSVWKK